MKRLVLEFLGSLGYLLLGCIIELLVVHFFTTSNFFWQVLLIALGFALAFGIFYSLSNSIYDIDVHPLFTFSSWLTNHISFYKMLSIILVQILGAIDAGFIISLVSPNLLNHLILGVTSPFVVSSFNTILLIEFFVAFIFISVYFYIKNKISSKKSQGLALGVLLFLLLVVSIPFTGGSVNPARGFVSNLYVNLNTLCQLGVYIFPSLAGALFSTIIYHLMTYRRHNVS